MDLPDKARFRRMMDPAFKTPPGEYQTVFTEPHLHKDGSYGPDLVAVDPKTGKLLHRVFHKEL